MQYSITTSGKNTDNQAAAMLVCKYSITITGKNTDNQTAVMLVCSTL